MPIFINWLEIDVSAPAQKLFYRDFNSWDESRDFHRKADIPAAKYCRFEIERDGREAARTVLFGEIQKVSKDFIAFESDLTRERRIAERLIEFNLGAHLAARGLHVESNKFGVTATKPAFRVNDIGFCAEVGVEFKAYYLHYQRQHGITLDWRVKQSFDRKLSSLPDPIQEALLGLPVILAPEEGMPVPPELKEFVGRYLGIVTKLEQSRVEVLCRDGERRNLSKGSLLPEPKTDVVSLLAGFSKEQREAESIQRRVMTLSYSLTPTGRRNVRILQDKLRAAIDFLNPNNRPAITVDFVPYSVGKMKVSTAPAIAQMERT